MGCVRMVRHLGRTRLDCGLVGGRYLDYFSNALGGSSMDGRDWRIGF